MLWKSSWDIFEKNTSFSKNKVWMTMVRSDCSVHDRMHLVAHYITTIVVDCNKKSNQGGNKY
jgi:hypothetical protein